MRKITELLKEDRRIWFYLRNAESQERFAQEAGDLGCRFLNGAPVTVESCSSIMSVHQDRKVAHVSWMVWDASFMPSFPERYCGDSSKILRVDYDRYVDGTADYLIEKCSTHHRSGNAKENS